MPIAVKILIPVAVVATTVGSVVAYSYLYRPQNVAPVAASEKGRATARQPFRDDALTTDPSWARWPSLTDY
jgi:hypothetical protein